MKRQLFVSAVVAAGLSLAGFGQVLGETPAAAQGAQLPGVTEIEHIADNVYKIFGAGGNTVVFVMEDGVALVDTKLPGTGEQILEQVRKITDKPIKLIINTHSHPDHVGANQFFRDAGNVEVIAHANSAARMSKPSGPFPANPVDREFTDKLTIGSGKDQIDLYYFGAGHTDGDAFVVFPAAKTIMMGDIMAWSMAPLIDPGAGGSALTLADTLEKAVAGIDGVETVIEGHGYVTDWQRFRDVTAFNRAVVEESKKAVAEGKEPKDVVAALKASGKYDVFLKAETLPGLEYGGTGRSRAMINAIVAMQELRGEEPQLIMNLPPDQQ